MHKPHPNLLQQAIAALDCVLIAGAFACAYLLVERYVPLRPALAYWVMVVGFLLFYLYLAWRNSLFSVLHFGWMSRLGGRLLQIFGWAGVVGAAILYLMPADYHGRRLYLAFVVLSLVLVSGEKLALRALLVWLRQRGRNCASVLLFGSGDLGAEVAADIAAHPQWGFRARWQVGLETTVEQFGQLLRQSPADEVFFCVSSARGGGAAFNVDPYLRVCEDMGRPARVFLDMAAGSSARWEFQRYLSEPTLVTHRVELDPDQVLAKRVFDLAGGLAGTLLLCLLYVPLALAIRCTSAGPVLFTQVRVGRNGRQFRIHKFRSMYSDAERRQEVLQQHNELSGPVFKMRDDPRVTPVGRLLRRWSLDEFPQFLNVLAGDMSIVGTRPPTPQEVSEYEQWHHRRISVKPGLTGLWQVSGRNRITDFDDIVRLDLQYIDNWSLWLDIKIIFLTVAAVFRKGEAY